MQEPVTARQDLKTAALLAAVFALLAAITVPFLLDVVPRGAPPLPLPVLPFSVALALQLWVVYGLLAWAGLRMARARGLDPAPVLTPPWHGHPAARVCVPAGLALGVGLSCGLFVVAVVAAIQRLAPQTLPRLLHPPSLAAALLASAAASVGEQLLCRLFLLCAILRVLPASHASTAAAVAVSAVLFGALHAPALWFLSGGGPGVPVLSWVWVIGLNGLLGVAFGWLFIRYGIGAAIIAHFGTDLVWHVMSQAAG
jgi:hypothetical protein